MSQQTKAESRLNCRKLCLERIHYVFYSQICKKSELGFLMRFNLRSEYKIPPHLQKPFKQKYQTFIFASNENWDLYANIKRKEKRNKQTKKTTGYHIMRTPKPAFHSQKSLRRFWWNIKIFYPLQTIIKYDYYQQY